MRGIAIGVCMTLAAAWCAPVLWAQEPVPTRPAPAQPVARPEEPAPGPNIEFTVYTVKAAGAGDEAAPLPPALEKTAAKIREEFGQEKLLLVDTLFVRTRAGEEVQSNGMFRMTPPPSASPDTSAFMNYKVAIQSGGVVETEGSAPVFNVQNFVWGGSVELLTPSPAAVQQPDGTTRAVVGPMRAVNQRETGFQTSADITENQPVLLGKMGMAPLGDTYFIILLARKAG